MLSLNNNPIYLSIKEIFNTNSDIELEYSDLTGKLILITGDVSTDTGFNTALLLAKMNSKLILANSKQSTTQIITKLKTLSSNSEIYYEFLDFSSLTNIKQFIQSFSYLNKNLDILINLGDYSDKFDISEDKYELNLQLNYLGLVMLSLGLVPILSNTEGARIVNFCNIAYRFYTFDKIQNFRDFSITSYNPFKELSKSNYYIKLFTKSLSKKLGDIPVICVNTGIQKSNINNELKGTILNDLANKIPDWISNTIFRNGESSGILPVYLATSNNLITGGCYESSGRLELESISLNSDKLADELFEYTLKELIVNLDR